MNQRVHYLLQILETIGSPLMSAITHNAPGEPDADMQSAAQAMASLLGKTVEASIELGNIMEINPAEAQDDTLRVALAGLAGPLVAGQYKKRGRVPDSADIKKMTNALQAVLTFSDNFAPTPETVERLKNLKATGQDSDSYQAQIQYMQAFIPVVEAVAAFPFGQPEAKLIMDVSEKLVKRSVELRESLLPDVSDDAVQKRAELAMLRALAELYSACHRAETQKATMQAQDGTAVSIDPVWKAFDLRVAMLDALATSMVPGGESKGDGSKAPTAPVSESPQEQAPPPASPPPEAPPATQSPPTPPATPSSGANPMAMFAKPKDGDDSAAAPPAPPEPPSGEQKPPGGNPMSFFKKNDESGDE